MEELIKLSVIGSPIAHSLSPKIHKIFAESLGLSISYDAILVNPEDFNSSVAKMFEKGFTGMNVTLPLKELAYNFADNQSAESKLCGSANTLWKEGSTIYADSTDGRGLVNDLRKQQIDLKEKEVVLLGAGGSAKAIMPSLLRESPKRITIVNRTELKAVQLANKFPESKNLIQAQALSERLGFKPDIIINSTSAGVLKQDISLPEDIFHQDVFVYDLSYSSGDTSFIKIASSYGVTNYSDGLGMLIEQAALSFEIWTSKKPQTHLIREQILS